MYAASYIFNKRSTKISFSKVQCMVNSFILPLLKKCHFKKYVYVFMINMSKSIGNIPKIESLVTFDIVVYIPMSTM